MGNETAYIPMRVQTSRVADEQWESILDKINRHTIEPVTQDDIFTFSGICSNSRMDAYLTRMHPESTLPNYVEDLQRGTPLMANHDISTSPYGRSYDGEMVQSQERSSGEMAVRGYWYIIRDLEMNGMKTNDQIRAIKYGISKDMSVGFGGDELMYECSSCGRNMFDYDCTHIPGLEDENGQRTFAWIKNGRLREVSTVYKGATPGANIDSGLIDKARAYVQQGQLSQENIYKLERAYQVRFEMDEKRSIFMPKKERENMNLLDQIREALKDNTVEKARIYDVLQAEGETYRHADDIAIRNELGEQASVESIRQLKTDAENGKKYVADLIDKAVAERVKVQKDAFDAEKYRATLVRVGDIDFIKDELSSYETQAKIRFKGGRQTEQEDLNDETLETETRSTPSKQSENIFE